MKNDNSTKFPNLAKRVLAVAFFFKVRKFSNYDKYYFGFHNVFFRIGKNSKKGHYVYLFFDFTTFSFRQLHKGIKLPITGLQITIWCIIFNLLWIPFRLITFIPLMYLDGGRNFIVDSDWYQNVRFFNWINFIALIILICVTLFKSYC